MRQNPTAGVNESSDSPAERKRCSFVRERRCLVLVASCPLSTPTVPSELPSVSLPLPSNMLSNSLSRLSQYTVRKQRLPKASSRRSFASFEEASRAPHDEVPSRFTPPPSSSGDSQTLPLVQKARSLLESRSAGTLTTVSLKPEDVRFLATISHFESTNGKLTHVCTHFDYCAFRNTCHCSVGAYRTF